MNYKIMNNKKQLKILREERDQLFSILDEVSYEQQTILLESIMEISHAIDKQKNNLKELINENN